MGAIQKVRRQVIASTVDAGAIGRAQQPFQQGARVLSAFAQKQEEVDIASAKSEVAKANAQLNRQYNDQYDKNTVEFQGDPTKASQDLEARFAESTQAINETLTSERAKQLFASTSLDMSSRYKLKHDSWADIQVRKNAVTDIDTTATEYSDQAYEAGSKGDFDQYIAIQAMTNDVVIAANGVVAEGELGKISTETTKDNAMQYVAGMTRVDPEQAISLVDSGKLDEVFSLEERDGLKDAANVRKKEIKLAAKADTVIREQELLLALDSPEGDSFNKTLEINQLEIEGKISKPFAVQARRLVTSQKAVDALTTNDDMAGLITQMYDLNAIAEIDASGYLDGMQSIDTKIAKLRADGKISASDAVKLQNQKKTLTASKVAGATQDIAIFFTDASDTFKSLPPEQRGAAMRQMFYATEGNFDLSQEEMVAKANNIVDTINKDTRGKVLTSVNATLASQRNSSDAEFLKAQGFSDADVKETATKYRITEQEVIQRLRGQ